MADDNQIPDDEAMEWVAILNRVKIEGGREEHQEWETTDKTIIYLKAKVVLSYIMVR